MTEKTFEIEWIDRDKEVPGYGLFKTGQVYTVSSLVGGNLVKQGQARRAKKKKSSKTEETA